MGALFQDRPFAADCTQVQEAADGLFSWVLGCSVPPGAPPCCNVFATVLQRFCNGPTGSGKILIVDLLYNDFRALQSGTCKLKRHNIGYSQENRREC